MFKYIMNKEEVGYLLFLEFGNFRKLMLMFKVCRCFIVLWLFTFVKLLFQSSTSWWRGTRCGKTLMPTVNDCTTQAVWSPFAAPTNRRQLSHLSTSIKVSNGLVNYVYVTSLMSSSLSVGLFATVTV